MEPSLRLLVLNNICADSALLVQSLEQSGCSVVCVNVSSTDELRSTFVSEPCDIIIARFIPGEPDVFEALDFLLQSGCDVPLIVVSNAPVGEDAISLIRAGAYDYVQGNNIPRLTQDIVEALNDAGVRKERRRAVETALQASQGKDMFLAFLSHELRNPLSTITNTVHLLKSLDTTEPTVVRAREMIERAAATQARLLEDMLDISRIAVGQVELHIAPVKLDALVTNVVQDIAFAAEDKGLEIILDIQPGLTFVGDGFRIQQVLHNLMRNAVKYTPSGSIRVSAKLTNGQVSIQVEDTGIGIEPGLLPHIFDTFIQARESRSYAHEGMGLGLALAKYLVELHGGEISAKSGGPGKGSTFAFSLPAAQSETYHPYEMVSAPVPSGISKAVKVLIVDDNTDARESLRDVLALDGCSILEAENGNDALIVAISEQPDVILLDIGLPGSDGFEVARRLRTEIGAVGTTIVAVTGYGEEHVRTRAIDGGFDEHLTKPVNLALLRGIVSRAGRSRGRSIPAPGP